MNPSDVVFVEAVREDTRPKYRVLQDRIRRGIADGSLTVDNKLPAEHDMARAFGVAYMTIRAAVNALVADGVLQRIHGKGTFVRRQEPVERTATGVLALVVPSLSSLWNVAGLYYFPGIVQGFCAEATRLGYDPTVIGRAPGAFTAAVGELTYLAGAACLLVSRDDAGVLETLRDQGLTAVAINEYRGRRAISSVAVDQFGGMGAAVRRLVEQNHRHIAFLPGPDNNLGAAERQRGYLRACAELGLTPQVVGTQPADYTDLSGVVRTRALLAGRNRPTAIIAAGDLIAAGALQAAREAGLSVPGELSIVGYGDFEIATHLSPALTTVRLPLAELGAAAAGLLHEQIGGATRRRKAVLSTTLIERDSVAPARS